MYLGHFIVSLIQGCSGVWISRIPLYTETYIPVQKGQRDNGLTKLSPFNISKSRNPGNHSSISASTLSTMEQSSFVPWLVVGTTMSNVLRSPGNRLIRKYDCCIQIHSASYQ